ncbi:hypothetical protein VZT92_003634 [Zoarces viviparus]|uniref:Uncharacterized protein n=1 Tax=Zoarces viviparus TaxID=48416 RepID=A0AAW1FVC0_ZOAVI
MPLSCYVRWHGGTGKQDHRGPVGKIPTPEEVNGTTTCDRLNVPTAPLFTRPPNTRLSPWPMVEKPVCLLTFLETPPEFHATPGTPSENANSVLKRLCAAFHSVALNIEAAGAQQKHDCDRRMKHTAYEPGDLVWVDLPALARQKLSPKRSGPFKVLPMFGSGGGDIGADYQLLEQRDPRAKPKVTHYNRLKPDRSACSAERNPPSPSGGAAAANSSGPSLLTALSGSRPHVYWSPTTQRCSVPPDRAQTNVCPPTQGAATTSTDVGDNTATGSSSELSPVVLPFEGVRTKSGRCVRPPVRYGTVE